MSNKGFTLVELLAVITIIALLALVTTAAITKPLQESKEELYKTQLENISLAAKTWGSDNLVKLPEEGDCRYITVGMLQEYGLLDLNLIDPRNNKEISNDLKIYITTKLNSNGKLVPSYEVSEENKDECNKI